MHHSQKKCNTHGAKRITLALLCCICIKKESQPHSIYPYLIQCDMLPLMAEEWRAGIQRNFDAAIRGNQKVFDTMIEQHAAIVDAIRRRDISAAQLMEQHIRTVTIVE